MRPPALKLFATVLACVTPLLVVGCRHAKKRAAPFPTRSGFVVSPEPGSLDPTLAAVQRAQVLGERHLRIYFSGGADACYRLDRVTAHETADRVVVAVYVGRRPDAPTEVNGLPALCPAISVPHATDVELTDPLGTRTVVDARSQQPVPVR